MQIESLPVQGNKKELPQEAAQLEREEPRPYPGLPFVPKKLQRNTK